MMMMIKPHTHTHTKNTECQGIPKKEKKMY